MRLLELLNGDAALLRAENEELKKRAASADYWKQRAFIWRQRAEEKSEKHKKELLDLSTKYADEVQKRLELAARVRELEDKRHVGSEHCKHWEIDGKRVGGPSHFTPRAWPEVSEDDI